MIVGIPKDMYCNPLNPHFPGDHWSSTKGIIPIEKLSKSLISVSFFQGINSKFSFFSSKAKAKRYANLAYEEFLGLVAMLKGAARRVTRVRGRRR
jgi:hypothetical protein